MRLARRRRGAAPGAPLTTYRLQFHRGFRFRDALGVIPYLHDLGVSHVYASPILTARRGSTHGYDVTDPARINPELGTERDLGRVIRALRRRGMGLILDIVPNHMAASVENPWWRDVLRLGRRSPYAGFFDIDWDADVDPPGGRLVLPILGDDLDSVIRRGDLAVVLEGGAIALRLYDGRLPLDPRSLEPILRPALGSLRGSARLDADPRALGRLCRRRPAVARAIRARLRFLNDRGADPRARAALNGLLAAQNYRLIHWRRAGEEVNYRRFFSINDLVSLRMEDERVFAATHDLVLRHVRRRLIDGLRIDHVDGLRDPSGYLALLRRRAGRRTWIVVEKILGREERLPPDWPVAGTTGYDFLNIVNGLWLDPRGLGRLRATFARVTGRRAPFERMARDARRRFLRSEFAGAMRSLGSRLARLAAADRSARRLTPGALTRALVEVSACLPVYRTYVRAPRVSAADRRLIREAARGARRAGRALSPAALRFLEGVLLMERPRPLSAEAAGARLRFIMRWQQFTGAAMAKGHEDTALYLDNRLASMNEVGGDPDAGATPVRRFHRLMSMRRVSSSRSMSATATHDTKRGEDVRARLDVLSEVPREWDRSLRRWRRLNRAARSRLRGRPAPVAGDEILLYQTMLGAWPPRRSGWRRFRERLKDYAVKAAREAGENTSWTDPRPDYEAALGRFLDEILTPRPGNRFLPDLLRLQETLARAGAVNGLSQALVKITAPGVPDFYQGTELWDLNLVDPDNRRPVDFASRRRLLRSIGWRAGGGAEATVRSLRRWRGGLPKMLLIREALRLRRAHASLYLRGDYVPLRIRGPRSAHALAFARRSGRTWVITIVPRLVTSLLAGDRIGWRPDVWGSTAVLLPRGAPARFGNALTGESMIARGAGRDRLLPLRMALGQFPVALLASTDAFRRIPRRP